MRQFGVAAVALLVFGALQAAAQEGKKAEIKGPHICCGTCEKNVNDILGKIEGVSDVKCDRKNKTVTLTAADDQAAQKGSDALATAGYHGTIESSTRSPDGNVRLASALSPKSIYLCSTGMVIAALDTSGRYGERRTTQPLAYRPRR